MRHLKTLAIALVLAAAAPTAFAATGGTSMPWDAPLQRLQENLTGPVASIIVICATALAGLMWAFTDHGTGLRRLSQLAFGAGLALSAVNFVSAIGFSGAVL